MRRPPLSTARHEEDNALLALIAEHGPKAWGTLAEGLAAADRSFTTRTGKECRERYNMVIKGKVIMAERRRKKDEERKRKRDEQDGGGEEGDEGEGESDGSDVMGEKDGQHLFECRVCRKQLNALAFTRKQRRVPVAARVCIACTGDFGNVITDPTRGLGDTGFASNETMRKATYDELIALLQANHAAMGTNSLCNFWKEFGSRRLVARQSQLPTERDGDWHGTPHALRLARPPSPSDLLPPALWPAQARCTCSSRRRGG